MDDPGNVQDDDPIDTHDARNTNPTISPSGQVTHQDLVKGVDIEEEDEDDNSRGMRRHGQDKPSQSHFGRPGP